MPLARVGANTELQVDLRLDALVDGIHASGAVAGDVVMACRRCLAELAREVSAEVDEVFLTPAEAQSDEEYLVVENEIDLAPMLRDAMVLALPLNPLCRDDCLGLCPVCGADRNRVACGHEASPSDVRWGPLGDLRRRMTEG